MSTIKGAESIRLQPPDLRKQRAIPFASQVLDLRKLRNELVHELATEMGHRERRLVRDPLDLEELKAMGGPELRHHRIALKAARQQEISAMISQLTEWYILLVRASNEMFVVEYRCRGREYEPGELKKSWCFRA